MVLEVKEISSIEKLIELTPAWLDLLPDSGEDDVFLRPEWMETWWKVWGGQHRLRALEILRDGRTVGIAPFMLSPRGKVKRWRKLQFIATGPSDHLGVIAERGDEEVLQAVWEHVRGMKEWDVFEMRELWTSSPTYRSFQRCWPDHEMVKGVSPFVELSMGIEKFMQKTPSVSKHLEGRYWNKLSREFNVEYLSFAPPQDLRPRLNDLKEINMRRWEKEASSPFAMPGMSQFLSMLVENHSESLKIIFHGIYYGKVPVAMVMGFVHKKRYLYYIPGFNVDFSRYSPGSILRAKIIHECLLNGLDELDFLRGGEEHKFQFNAVDRGLVIVRAFKKGVLRGLEGHLREGELR